MPIKVTINGEPATVDEGREELELMLAGGLASGLTRWVLMALIAEIPTLNAAEASRETKSPNPYL